jgi:hypothetical protein
MRRWPAYTLEKIAALTPGQINWLLGVKETARDTITYRNYAEYLAAMGGE